MEELSLKSILYKPSETQTFSSSPNNPGELKRNGFEFLKKQKEIYIYTKPCSVIGIFVMRFENNTYVFKVPLKNRITAYFHSKNISKSQVDQFKELAQKGTLLFFKCGDELIIRENKSP